MPQDVVITDTVFQGLVTQPDKPAPLIPRLHFLNLTSRLGFADPVYADFVISRAIWRLEQNEDPAEEDYGLFKTDLWWPRAPQRDVSSEILDDLSVAEEVIFESGPIHLSSPRYTQTNGASCLRCIPVTAYLFLDPLIAAVFLEAQSSSRQSQLSISVPMAACSILILSA
jgi:hypothetical protein